MLEELIKLKKLDILSPDEPINEEAFPPQEISNGEYKLFYFGDSEKTEDFVNQEMKKEGFRPANIYELLKWDDSSYSWKEFDWVIALGSKIKGNFEKKFMRGIWIFKRTIPFFCIEKYSGRRLSLCGSAGVDESFNNAHFLGVK